MVLLGKELIFPPVEMASTEGILAFGGDLSPDRLMLAYQSGIFPWYNEGEPIIWYCPDLRMVLFPEELRVSKSMKRFRLTSTFTLTWNKAFEQVIDQCQKSPREGQNGTWITQEMKEAYTKLHQLGFAKSIEVWDKEELVGGLYGIDLGNVFCGESMFNKKANASKLAFIYLVEELQKKNYQIIDCQVYTEHLESLGAREIPRTDFIQILKNQ